MITITNKLATDLRWHAEQATNSAYLNAERLISRHCVAASQREPWHVAQLCASVRQLAPAWRGEIAAELPQVTVSMSSVFTHQTPRAHWTHTCELADLLIAVIDRRGIQGKGVAILVQAKNAVNGQVKLTSQSEKKQLELLSQRPVFDVSRSGPRQVNLTSYHPDSALLYGLASTFPPLYPRCLFSPFLYPTWLMSDALGRLHRAGSSRVIASDTLSSVLVDLLRGASGWKFDLPPSGQNWTWFAASSQRDDWSMLMNFLLEDTFKGSMSNRLAIGAGQSSRGKEEPLFFRATAPRNGSMFLMTDGHSGRGQFATASSEDSSTPEWRPASFENWSGDGGANGRSDGDETQPEDGPISALILELGDQG